VSLSTLDRAAVARAAAAVARRPARWRRTWVLAVGLVAALVVALVIGAYAAVPHLVRFAPDAVPAIEGPDGLVVEEYGARGTHFVHYTQGQQFTVAVPLTNAGPLPMKVTEVRLTDEVSPLVETRSVTVAGDGLPVTIGAGDTVTVELTAEFGNCRYYHERAVQTMPGAIVDGSVLGRDFRKLARFDHPLAVHSQVILRCPDRTLVRGDDIRGRGPAPGRGNAG
jgi:hypothetical protein